MFSPFLIICSRTAILRRLARVPGKNLFSKKWVLGAGAIAAGGLAIRQGYNQGSYLKSLNQNLGNVFPVNGEPAQGLPANAAYVCTLLYGGVIFVILMVLAVVCGCSYLDNAVNNPNSELNRGKSGGDSEPSTSTSGTRKKKKKQTLKSAANKSAASRFSRRCCRRRRRRSASRLQFEQWYRF